MYRSFEEIAAAAKAHPRKRTLAVAGAADTAVLPWEEYEKQIIANALRQCGSFNAAAKMLKITHKTVAAKARKYDLV